MRTSEARSFSNHEVGCAGHGLPDCLCDVQPLEQVAIQAVPRAERLLQLGLDRLAFLTWAEELTAGVDTPGGLRVLAGS